MLCAHIVRSAPEVRGQVSALCCQTLSQAHSATIREKFEMCNKIAIARTHTKDITMYMTTGVLSIHILF